MDTVTTRQILNRSGDKIIKIILERFCIFTKISTRFLDKNFSLEGEVSKLEKTIKENNEIIQNYESLSKKEKVKKLKEYSSSLFNLSYFHQKEKYFKELEDTLSIVTKLNFLSGFQNGGCLTFKEEISNYLSLLLMSKDIEKTDKKGTFNGQDFEELEQLYLKTLKQHIKFCENEIDILQRGYKLLEGFKGILYKEIENFV